MTEGFEMAQILRRLARRLRYRRMTARLNGAGTAEHAADLRRGYEERAFEQYLVDQGVIAEQERVA